VDLPHLWTGRPTWRHPRQRALPDVRDLLAPARRRAAIPPTARPRDPAAVPPLWATDPAAQTRPLQCLLPVLAPVWHRAGAAAAPMASRNAAPLSDMRTAQERTPPRPVPRLLYVLASDGPRAPARPAAENSDDSAPLPPVRTANCEADPRRVPYVLSVPAPHRPRAPRAAVAALMDPPEGYVALPHGLLPPESQIYAISICHLAAPGKSARR
jgi:hypothetical protein